MVRPTSWLWRENTGSARKKDERKTKKTQKAQAQDPALQRANCGEGSGVSSGWFFTLWIKRHRKQMSGAYGESYFKGTQTNQNLNLKPTKWWIWFHTGALRAQLTSREQNECKEVRRFCVFWGGRTPAAQTFFIRRVESSLICMKRMMTLFR